MPFPIKDLDVIAPYWFDRDLIDLMCNESLLNDCSLLYYQETFSFLLQRRVGREINAGFGEEHTRSFFPRSLFIITWVIPNPKNDSYDQKVILSINI